MGFSGVELSLEWPRVDGKKRVTLLQVGAVSEMNFRNASGHLRLDGDHFASHASAHFVEVQGDIVRNRGSNRYGSRRPFECRWVFFRASYQPESCNARQTNGLPKTGHESSTPIDWHRGESPTSTIIYYEPGGLDVPNRFRVIRK